MADIIRELKKVTIERERERDNRQIDRQTDRQTERQTDKQTYHTARQTD